MSAGVPGRLNTPLSRRGAAGSRVLLAPFRGLPDLLQKFAVPSAAVLRQFGLSKAQLEAAELSGSFAELSRLLGHCATTTNCGHFALLLSRSVSLRSLGVVGRLARHAPTVRVALEGLVTYFELHDGGAALDLRVEDEAATFSYAIHTKTVTAREQVYDFATGVMVNLMKELCGADWRPQLVMLPRKPPQDPKPYKAAFGAPLQFDTLQAAVVFSSGWLARPVPSADPILYRLLLREACASVEQKESLVCSNVRRAIIRLLHEGRCSRREVARMLGLHERTLGRALSSSGTTFQQLLDDTRSELARQFLRDTHVPISRIARELGFRDTTVLARAFRRWNHMSPREYRNGLRSVH